jgi:hypothetical protein
MASELTPNIGLFKPIPGTAEPFRAADINGNWDLLDSSYNTIVQLQTQLADEFDDIVADGQAAVNASVAAAQDDVDDIVAAAQVTVDASIAASQDDIDDAIAAMQAATIEATDDILGYLEAGTIINGGTA